MKGDRSACYKILSSELSRGVDIEDIYSDYIQKSLYKVGELWESNKISVAVEHMITGITEVLLAQLLPHVINNDKNSHKVVVACSEYEMHQVGGRIVADYFELNGWDSHFLGANTPTNDLLDMVEQVEPDVIGLSVSIYYNMRHLYKTIERIQKKFPDKEVIVGGQAFRWGGADITEKFDNIKLLTSVSSLKSYMAEDRWI